MPKTLLLADDSVTIQKVVGISFANEDVVLLTVDNGDEAITRAREARPDLVLADVVMPGKDGYEVCEAIKSDPELGEIPVLLLTGTFEAFDEERARRAGADGHITKPFEAQVLVDQVNGLLERSAASSTEQSAAPANAAEPGPDSAGAYDFFDDEALASASAPGEADVKTAAGVASAEPTRAPLAKAPTAPSEAASTDAAWELEDSEMGTAAVEDSGPTAPDQAADLGATAFAAEEPATDTDLFADMVAGPEVPPSRVSAEPGDARAEAPPLAEDRPAADLEQTQLGETLGRDDPLDLEFGMDGTEEDAQGEALVEPLVAGDPLADLGPEEFAGETLVDPDSARDYEVSASDVDDSSSEPTSQAESEGVPTESGGDAPGGGKAQDLEALQTPETVPPELRRHVHETLEKVAWEAFGDLSERIVREAVGRIEAIAWEVIPQMAETLIREEIRRLKGERG